MKMLTDYFRLISQNSWRGWQRHQYLLITLEPFADAFPVAAQDVTLPFAALFLQVDIEGLPTGKPGDLEGQSRSQSGREPRASVPGKRRFQVCRVGDDANGATMAQIFAHGFHLGSHRAGFELVFDQ